MEKIRYENYPFWITLISNLLTTGIYALGAVIIYKIGLLWVVLYLAYCLILQIKLLKTGCVNCYYYGKVCAFARGKLCSFFFDKGTPAQFCGRQFAFKDFLPDLLVSMVPVITGIVLLITDFSWLILLLVAALFLLSSAGNGMVRGSLACRYCKQLDLGCPASQFFNKK